MFRHWRRGPSALVAVWLSVGPLTTIQNADAVPAFARKHNLSCVSCHVLPPKLNAFGEAFLARGYRMPPEGGGVDINTTPLSAWVTGRYEDHRSRFDRGFFNRIELIGAGPIGSRLSYFVEWRPLSLETRGNGTLRDRSGRFEDVLLNVELDARSSVSIGQYRSLRQVDVSRRLSLTEPLLFSASLPGDRSSDRRIESLRAFAPSGRSPGFTYQHQSIAGDRPGDGLFHLVTVPFAGELSLPLTDEAQDEASFELEGRAKGVFLETYYRQALNSIGLHAFLDDDRWLAQGVGTFNCGDLYAMGGVGVQNQAGSARVRYSLEGEYIPTRADSLRWGLGFRVEHITGANREPAFIPYLALSGPNTARSFLLTVQYRAQKNNDALLVEIGGAF